ncbi:MAG: hypothetical protein COC12_07250 [Rhodobacteraceae bacterium]|nr:MAG: hypothetical protein COC12_07250 [Paracoccaceae bacterium]
MKMLALTALTLSGFALSSGVLMANPMADVCRARAVDASGYRGLAQSVGNVQFGLSGSVSVGVGRSNGPQSGSSPAFAGQGEIDRQKDAAKARYTRVYDDCMRTR